MFGLPSLGALDFIGIITTIVVIYVAHFYYKYFTRVNPLPGAIPLPLVGNLFGIVYYANGDISIWHKILREKYGDIFEIYLGSSRKIALARTEYIEKLMSSSNNSIYKMRSLPIPAIEEFGLLKSGLSMNNHIPTWKLNRKLFSQAMLTPSFSKQVLHWTPILFNELNEYWKEIGEDTSIDFSVWVHSFTTEIIFHMTVGLKVNSMATHYNHLMPSKKKFIEPNPVVKDIENCVEVIMKSFDDFIFAMVYPPFVRRNFVRERNQAMLDGNNKVNELMADIINHRRKEIKETPVDEELRSDLLTLLITEVVDEEPLTNYEIGRILLEAIGGGIDTTANLLCYIVYYMAKYPNVLARLRQELDSIFGLDQDRSLTMEDLSKMHYTEAIIKECSRLVVTVKLVDRVSSEPDVVAGYEWPANTTFTCYLEGIHHNPKYWKDPHKFDPDRFMGTEIEKNSFLMFGGGVRICPGRRLAMVELKCLMALIYRNLDIGLVDMDAPLKLKHNIVNTCTELMVKIRQRKV